MRWTSLLLTLCVGSWCFLADAREPSLVVGVLEDPQCKHGADRAIRPLFAKNGADWVVLTSQRAAADFFLEKLEWTAALNGKAVGRLRSSAPKGVISPDWTYPRDYLHILDAGQRLPEATNTTSGFFGWCDAPQHRPVVVVSEPNIEDPEGWMRNAPLAKDIEHLFISFKDATKGRNLCRALENGGSAPYKYGPADLKIATAYQNALGQQLLAVTLKDEHGECESELGWPESPKWFFVDRSVTYLGNNLMLVDVGDYDGDGHSEVLFWYSAYNRDGYVLFSDGMKTKVAFTWGYH